jgi:uncharacterized protein (DUF111 family)
VIEFRTVIDDATSEAIAFLLEQCFAAGALEAYAIPATMKKSRPGHEITVLSSLTKAASVEQCLFHHGGTFGLRVQEISRSILEREFLPVELPMGTVQVKIGRRAGTVLVIAPEYEDCRQLALTSGKTLKEIYFAAETMAREKLKY